MKNSLIVGICGLLLVLSTGCSSDVSKTAVFKVFNGKEITQVGKYSYVVRGESNQILFVRCYGTVDAEGCTKENFMKSNVTPLFNSKVDRLQNVQYYPVD